MYIYIMTCLYYAHNICSMDDLIASDDGLSRFISSALWSTLQSFKSRESGRGMQCVGDPHGFCNWRNLADIDFRGSIAKEKDSFAKTVAGKEEVDKEYWKWIIVNSKNRYPRRCFKESINFKRLGLGSSKLTISDDLIRPQAQFDSLQKNCCLENLTGRRHLQRVRCQRQILFL